MPRQASDAFWVAAIDDFRSSGLTQPEFCRRRGLPLHTFRRRLYARPSAATSPATGPAPAALVSPDTPRFLPLTVVAGPTANILGSALVNSLVLIIDDRIRIAVSSGFDSETLRRLIDALGTQP